MEAFTDPKIRKIVMVAASQVGKSELELNVIGYIIDQDPGSIIFVQPTLDDARKFSRLRIAPMIRDIAFAEGENVLRAAVTVQAQNPGLNPQLLEKAIARYLPELTPDFVRVRRRELLDADGQVFR